MGQEAEVFARHGIGPLDDWTPLEAPARRRRWYDDGNGTMAVLLASASDLDDLIPTLVAYQIEWNKLRLRLRAADWPPDVDAPDAGRVRRGARRGGGRLVAARRGVGRRVPAAAAVDGGAAAEPARADARRLVGRLRADDAPLVGAGAGDARRAARCDDRPMYFVSSNPHSMVNLRLGHGAPARGRGHRLGRVRRARRPARRARRVPRRPHRRLVGELPLLLARATSSRRSRRRCARRARRRSGRSASRTSPRAPRCASPRR